jgi:DNA polymerase-3 subunit delta'
MEEFNESRKILSSESYVPIIYEKNLQIVRELVDNVLEKLLESSFEGGRKVCIILNAERFNKTTANRMLKILEEPPADVHFIMTAEQISMVLPTIVSRSSVLRFRRLRETEISYYLEKFSSLDKDKARVLARMAEGGIKTAKALNSDERRNFIESSFKLYSEIALGKPENAVSQVSDYLWSRNVLEAEEILKGFAVCTRAVLQQKLNIKRSTNELFNKASELGKKTDLDSIDKLSKKIEEGMEMLGRNVNISSVMTYVFYGINEAYGK